MSGPKLTASPADRDAWLLELYRTAHAMLHREVAAVCYEHGSAGPPGPEPIGPDVHSVVQAVTFGTTDEASFQVLWTWYRGRNYDLDLVGPMPPSDARFGSFGPDGFEPVPPSDCSSHPMWAPFLGQKLRSIQAYETTALDPRGQLDAFVFVAQDGSRVTVAAREPEFPTSPGADHVLVLFGRDAAARHKAGESDPHARVVMAASMGGRG